MQHVFWLLPGRLAGRAGPNRVPWDLRALRAQGIDAVLSVNDGEACDLAEFAAQGLQYRCVPFPPNEPPLAGDEKICRQGLPVAYEFVRAQHAAGRAVLVHCSAGKDRTGLFMSYFLMREHDLTADEAIAYVRGIRPPALSAMGWEGLARRVLARPRPGAPPETPK
jgi:protein-tyrosine phosphatase